MKRGLILASFGFLIAIMLFLSFSVNIFAAVPDQDQDGVPDADDQCPNSATNIVDQFGCSCTQLNCASDNNSCTDDCGADTTGRVACNYLPNNGPCPGGYCSNGVCDADLAKETITCVFMNTEDIQECFSEKGRCSTNRRCEVNVQNKKGEKVTWRSTCGGYASTTIDGIDERIMFNCAKEFTLKLYKGWNLFSSPIFKTGSSQAFTQFENDCDYRSPLWGYSIENKKYEKTAFAMSSPKGYWIKTANDCTVKITGDGTYNAGQFISFLRLEKGWNIIGGAPDDLEFNRIKGNCIFVKGPYWYNTALNRYEVPAVMEHGKGYIVKVQNNCQFAVQS